MHKFYTKNLIELLEIISQDIVEQKELLTELDAIVGDGDLGVNMESGFRALCKEIRENGEMTLAEAFEKCGFIFNQAAPSTLGTIISSAFFAFASVTEEKDFLNRKQFADMMDAAIAAVSELGGAKPGDRTILDSMLPYTAALRENISDVSVWKIAAGKAEEAAALTAELIPRTGRARMYGEKSRGIRDGGAVLFSIVAKSIEKYFTLS